VLAGRIRSEAGGRMRVFFHIPGPLRAFAEGNAQVRVEGSAATLREALLLLWQAHPGLRDRVVTESGELREHVNLFVGNESIRYAEGLSTGISDGAEVSIIPAISGGWNQLGS